MLQVYLAAEKREPPALGEGLHNAQPIRAKLCPQPRGSQERPYFLSAFEITDFPHPKNLRKNLYKNAPCSYFDLH
jgi:hypothetical protein